MNKDQTKNNLKFSLIMTTIAIVTWVFFSIYNAIKKPLPIVIDPKVLEPLQLNLDDKTFEMLQQRFKIEEDQLPEITPKPVSTNNPTASQPTNNSTNPSPTPTVVEE